MTIAEIIAAKKAAAHNSQPVTNRNALDCQPTVNDLEVEAAIDRIDPPGKRRAGLVVSNKTPLQPAVIAEKVAHAESRSLSRTKGEAIPMVPTNADAEMLTWHAAQNALETELCVMRDPADLEAVWLAVKPYRAGMEPILLHRLPWTLWEYPHRHDKDQPF
jgi:hypothetical protein